MKTSNHLDTIFLGMFGVVVIVASFTFIEPAVVDAVDSQFRISQSVTSEISFLTPATDITMSPALAGVTGGTSNGSTQVVVLTNNAAGYHMTLTASSSAGMLGNTQGGTIPAYVPQSANVPDYTFTTPVNTARFGYTVEASTTSDLDAKFMNSGTTCNSGSADAADSCWLNASSSAVQIVNRLTSTPSSGATTTIKFRAVITSNPAPAIPQDTYVATTTLTATVN
jgi:hypothetical protein